MFRSVLFGVLDDVHRRFFCGSRTSADADILGDQFCLGVFAEPHVARRLLHLGLAPRVLTVADLDELLSGRNPGWIELVTKMRAHYTMEDERRLFDLVMWAFPGATVKREEEALASSVELF